LNDAAAENGDSADRRSQAEREGDPLALVKAELAAKDRKIISLEGIVAHRETEIRGLEAALAGVYASTTWKLGAPLRLGRRLLGRIARLARREQLALNESIIRPQGEAKPANYPEWQRARLAQRLIAANPAATLWNHFFTVVIFADGREGTTALAATLASLHRQTYRNIEVLIAGVAPELPPGIADFTGHRGLFVEPALHALELLASPAADRLWRGSYLTFARAGTEFAPDAFALFNAALDRGDDSPAPDLIVCDHDRLDDAGNVTAPSLVPGWDPDFICEFDYVETAFAASRALVLAQRAERPASLHDWLCRIARRVRQPVTRHVAEPLVHVPASAPRPILQPAKPAVIPALGAELPTLAVVIPNRNKPELLARCVSFLNFANRFRAELVVIDNASDEAAVRTFYRELTARHGARIVQMDRSFNFSRMVNAGVAASRSALLLLLNNDVEITAPGLLELAMAHAMRPEVGVVGSRLMYPDNTVQHAGMVLRPGPTEETRVRSEHVGRGAPAAADGYLYQLRTIRNYQCVTGALHVMRREVFDRLGGFDEVAFPVEFGDVDFCLRARRAGYRVIALPLDGVIHRESSTRGRDSPPAVVAMRTAAMEVIVERWPEAVAADPCRNPWIEVGEVPEARFPWSGEGAS
jgi:O-antigen biosynthesis protein